MYNNGYMVIVFYVTMYDSTQMLQYLHPKEQRVVLLEIIIFHIFKCYI